MSREHTVNQSKSKQGSVAGEKKEMDATAGRSQYKFQPIKDEDGDAQEEDGSDGDIEDYGAYVDNDEEDYSGFDDFTSNDKSKT
jgi:hypothetical protein